MTRPILLVLPLALAGMPAWGQTPTGACLMLTEWNFHWWTQLSCIDVRGETLASVCATVPDNMKRVINGEPNAAWVTFDDTRILLSPNSTTNICDESQLAATS